MKRKEEEIDTSPVKIFFSADSHWGHGNILGLCNRPFKTIWEHDQGLIDNWNSVVTDHDVVYHLGDFGYKCSVDYLVAIMVQLKGKIFFIKGNHDDRTLKANNKIHRFEEIHERMEIKVPESKLPITLSHYPMLSWNHSGRGSWQLYGHLHGRKMNTTNNQLDVGVDSWNYFPVSIEQVAKRLNSN